MKSMQEEERFIQAIEKERLKLAMELHDDILQRVGMLKSHLPKPESLACLQQDLACGLKQHHQFMQNLIEGLLHSGRRLIHAYSGHPLEQFDLGSNLQMYLKELQSYTQVSFMVSFDPQWNHFNTEASSDIFRVVQEAINNVLKHAQATIIEIIFGVSKGHYWFQIEDNGKGFNTSEVFGGHDSKRFGMRSMHFRVQKWGGELSIQSDYGEGTTLMVSFNA